MYYTMENFIDYCDNTHIVNESRFGNFKEEFQELFLLKGNSYAESIDENHKSKGKLDLSNFEWIVIDKNTYNNKSFINNINKKYKNLNFNFKSIQRAFRADNYRGIIIYIVDSEKHHTVATASIDTQPKQKLNHPLPKNAVELINFNIYKRYQGFGLSNQILKELISRYKINILEIFDNAQVQQRMYEKVGFKIDPSYNDMEGIKVMIRK